MYPSQDFVNGVMLMVSNKYYKTAKELLDILDFETEEDNG